jgi:pSer/pThr/pTyr-binding forkhead associated (FHA) protein
LPDASVSGEHAALAIENDAIVVRDLGSRNGTYLGRSKSAIRTRRLPFGQTIRVGAYYLRLLSPDAPHVDREDLRTEPLAEA